MNEDSPPLAQRRHKRLLGLKICLTVLFFLVMLSFVSWSSGLFNPVFDSTLLKRPAIPTAERIILAEKILNLQFQIGNALQHIDRTRLEEQKNCSETLKRQVTDHSNILTDVVASLDRILDTLKRPTIANVTTILDFTASSTALENADAEESFAHNSLFQAPELRKYTEPRQNRHGRRNFLGAEAVFASIGFGCPSMGLQLETYMTYNESAPCPDDWPDAQKLIIQGCDPPPRRRCFAAAPKDGSRILWTHYKCKTFSCLASRNTSKGFHKCSECFDLESHESRRWQPDSNITAEYSIDKVLQLKPPGEIQIGLDFGPGTGTFAAILKRRNVTIISATLNLGAPFSETIAMRGLVPLYLSVNQRLPFFDNTLDLVHTSLFLDGWIDTEMLEFVLFDWDRVLRPGGLLWVDRFFCVKEDVGFYVEVFEKLGYRRRLWTLEDKVDKNAGEVFLSAVLEKTAKSH